MGSPSPLSFAGAHELRLPGADHLTRGGNAVIGLTANSTTEAIYYLGSLGSDSQPLTGAKRYSITFKGPHSVCPGDPTGLLVSDHV